MSADIADRADGVIEHHLADSMSRHRASVEREAEQLESMQPHIPGTPLPCLDCGEIIDPRRLKTLPLASRCTDCAEHAEKLYRERAWMPR